VYPCVKTTLDNTHQLTDRSHINLCVIVKSRLLQNVFEVIVRLGEPLIVGKSNFEVSCAPNQEFDSEANVEVYESSDENPMYTIDKGVKLLGVLTVLMPDINGRTHPYKRISH
jgi:hypothetical protein